MATNYTTKTAALKATTADIRKVTAKQVFVDHTVEKDGETVTESANVIDLINNAGLTVGSDPNGDYTPDTFGKTNKINFLGTYVNVVETADGTNIYIGENNNNPSFKNATDTLAEAKYIFASSSSKWSLPTNVSGSATSTYAYTSSLTGTETVTFKNTAGQDQIGNILADSVIKVTVVSDKGKGTPITYTTGKISEAAQAGASKTWEDTAKGIKVSATSLKYYTSADAEDGFTPGSTTGKFTVTLDNDKLVGANGGWYNVKVEMGGVSDTSATVYVYDGQNVTPSVGTPTITYKAGTAKYISGLVYDSSGTFTLSVPTISNTQYAMTDSMKRLEVTGTFAKTVEYGDSGLKLTSGDATNETAVFSYTATNSPTATIAKKANATATVQAYGQSAVGGESKSASTTATTWLYTANTTDGDMTCNFCTDGKRVYNVLSDITGAKTINTYNSQSNLDTAYTTQLLVQDGTLRYPTKDTTGRYSKTASGTRYYVRPIKHTGSGQINNITVTVGSGMKTAFNNANVRLYLVKKGVADPMVLNWYKNAACSYGKPIADVTAPSSGKWVCTINNDVFQLNGGVADTYYLVVEMSGETEIGTITIA